MISKVVDLSETVLGLDHPDTVHRKQDFDTMDSQRHQCQSAGDDERAETHPNPNPRGPSILVHEGLTQTPEVTTETAPGLPIN